MDIPVEYKRLFDDDWREAAIYGGRFSLKSHTVARYLLIQARTKKTRVACFREYQNSIVESSHQLLSDLIDQYGLTDFEVTDKSIINKVNGSDFLFKGLHRNEQSIKSIEGIDIAWVEEAQSVTQKSIEVLTPTVRKEGSKIIYTYNRLTPNDPVHQRLVIEGRPNSIVINANYFVAEKYGYLPDVIKKEIEDDKKNRPNLYKHKWLGEPDGQEGKIYTNWKIIDELPHEAGLVRRGLDFGFSVDPAALVAVYKYNGGYILDEELYAPKMYNKDIVEVIKQLDEPNTIVIADSQEPKSIAQMKQLGLTIFPCEKGKDSIRNGIQLVQSHKVSVTRRSQNIIREYQNYQWKKDRNGDPVSPNIPEDRQDDHLMDAVRYAIASLEKMIKKERKPYSLNKAGQYLRRR